MLVIALIAAFYAAVAAVNKFAGTSVSATGIICGAFMAALAFIGNVFNDPVGAVCRLFFDLADTVLGILQALASAIDTIFGSNLSGAVQGWRDSLSGWVDETFGKGEEIMAKMNTDDLKLGHFEYGAAFDLGYQLGEGIEDTLGDLFKTPTLDEMGLDSIDAFNLGNNLDGIYGNTGDTAANTAAAADSLDYMDEDLAWMRDIAEREAINRYTTAEITVEQHNEKILMGLWMRGPLILRNVWIVRRKGCKEWANFQKKHIRPLSRKTTAYNTNLFNATSARIAIFKWSGHFVTSLPTGQ